MVLSAAAERFLAGPLLAEVDDAARLALFEALKEEYARAGTVLIAQGKPNDRLWFLIDGTAAIVRRTGDEEQPIARLEAPGIFGATSFFRPTPTTVSIRATSDVALLTLDHAAHKRLRRDEPRAAEALALATVRVLAERFDLLDIRVTEFLASYADDHRRSTEWAGFRARLFEEPNII
jgi:CRP/FNR family cyclic AMP-dependent transcriptional regulator